MMMMMIKKCYQYRKLNTNQIHQILAFVQVGMHLSCIVGKTIEQNTYVITGRSRNRGD